MPDDPASLPAAIDVVAGVIQDTRGRVLLARRTVGRDLAGLWEFPGGKREPGESPEEALARELHEELGIDVDVGAPVIAVPQRYPHKRLRLDVRHIHNWRGTARGREGQALVWVPAHKLASYAMPPADRPVVAALGDPAEYLVTPAPGADGGRWLASLGQALARGIRRVQLRNADADADWPRLVAQAVRMCRQAGAQVLVNADVDLAREHAAGLHLRAAQLGSFDVRPVPPDVPFAASCHSVQEVKAAEAIGCDFAVVGNLRESPSHPGRPGISWDGFARLREHVAIPLYAIGGLAPGDIAEARQHGAQGIAAIRGLWSDS
jgi:8-oxo-dGTP diphosphatase